MTRLLTLFAALMAYQTIGTIQDLKAIQHTPRANVEVVHTPYLYGSKEWEDWTLNACEEAGIDGVTRAQLREGVRVTKQARRRG